MRQLREILYTFGGYALEKELRGGGRGKLEFHSFLTGRRSDITSTRR